MRLLLDEMWSGRVAAELRRRGHDVIAVVEREDLRTEPDEAIFAAARSEDRLVVTANVGDFRALAAEAWQRGEAHAGLVFISTRDISRTRGSVTGHVVTLLDRFLGGPEPEPGTEHWLR